ncbi:MAG: 3-oxoacyl-[acyl-carrier-protein] reductase [Planctomycetia bacterium]|nr:3-oxoacyl-[acyl-carrier-protein] reductase [Planctomycetia bacterium]
MSDVKLSSLRVDLKDQVALITGASQGLGKAMALRLAGAGAKVACVARSVDKLAEVVATIREAGGTAEALACDVTDSASVDRTVEEVLKLWGDRLDIVVNNAGITRDTLVPRMSDDDWDQVIATNLRGTFLFTRAATRPMMSQRRGRIINISSVSGLMGNPGQANYSASKAGLIGFTQTVARELAKRNITVNCIAPGFIMTDMAAKLGETILGEAKKRIPANRLGTAEEVADCVLFLASDAAAYITGQVLVVDGGMTA